jgi:16S rRNA (guanine(527)-N(7))-methyltransferase RsmG
MLDIVSFKEKFHTILAINFLEKFDTNELAEKFFRLTIHLLEVNEHMNLTAITDPDGVILKHYVDSLTASAYIPEGVKFIDVGCGAGFPSLPLAIARPDITITALDSTAKRINFISETAEILKLSNISAISARAEDLAKSPQYRERFDISCARAVARLNVLCELCLPYVKKGGCFLAMKANADDELSEAGNAIYKLGGRIISVNRSIISSGDIGESNPRTIIKIQKISSTPNIYPRNNSQISKKPL